MAYLGRPLIYFQFDEDKAFGGWHITKRGYFDYREDGAGPVCVTVDAVLDELQSHLESGCENPQKYIQRMQQFFAFHDGRCCERVFELIRNTGETAQAAG